MAKAKKVKKQRGLRKGATDFVGVRFGRLIVISEAPRRVTPGGYIMRVMNVKCDCGTLKEVYVSVLKSGQTISCGCRMREVGYEIKKHGLSSHPLYIVWNGINRRCNEPTFNHYELYGGRGIGICKSWRNDFKKFYDWAIKNGWEKGLHVDRKNTNGNYSPSNCRIVTAKINANNKRNTRFFEINGITKSLSEWCDIYGVSIKNTGKRLRNGHSIESALKINL
jgi:hypothetical protein